MAGRPGKAVAVAGANLREVVVVVPCYNEARRLRIDQFAALASDHPRIGFLFVDDGSSDDTWALISEAGRGDGSVESGLRGLRLEQNRGKAEAVRRGMRQAIDGGATVVGFFDADLATPLDELEGMIELLLTRPELDGVLGSRIRLLGRQIERRGSRHYLGRVFATLASLILGLPVYDTQCGAKLFRVDDALKDALVHPFRSRWIFDVELIQRLNRWGGRPLAERLEEYPLRRWTDVDDSKLGAGAMLRAPIELLRLAVTSPPTPDRR